MRVPPMSRFSPRVDQIPRIQIELLLAYFRLISRMSLVPMISRISRRFTWIACC